MNDRRKVYWDSCAWLGLLNAEPAKMGGLQHVWAKATHGELEIWTSAFAIAEVYRRKCEGTLTGLSPENDEAINNMFDQDFVKVAQLDLEIGRLAKRLLRTHDRLKKPSDAIHLATAAYWDIEQFHTYDDADFFGLVVKTANGSDLVICKPDQVDGETLFNREQAAAGE